MRIRRLFLQLFVLTGSWSQLSFASIVSIDDEPAKAHDYSGLPVVQIKTRACRRQASREYIIKQAQPAQLETRKSRSLVVNEADRVSARQFLELEDTIENIAALDESYRSGSVDVQPWSGDYWAIRNGGAAKRYMDPLFPATSANTWLEAHQYFLAQPSTSVEKHLLSPAEKYDSLVVDDGYHLTAASWREGQAYQDEYGDVEAWMGLCHGWAPASFMEQRPTRTVRVKNLKADEGAEVTFYPDDVKALLSLKWAKGINVTEDLRASGTRFLGGRCNEKEPQRDPDSGRIIDDKCNDINPGTWHIVVTNQIARSKRPFIIDASFDSQVWNQPVVRYSYSYFNPKTSKLTSSLSNARVSLQDPDFQDIFKNFRNNPSAVEVVGIKMMVTYVVETTPVGRETDDVVNDAENTVSYYYDLELDEAGNVVGGEWYQNKHPDFIWMPVQNSIVLNQEDLWVHDSASAMALAPALSQQSGAPLRYVLDQILSQLDVDRSKPSP